MKKIAIITTYHGKFPNTIGFWLKSVEKNPTIDFFLFTDLDLPFVPKNLHVIKMSFKDIVDLAQRQYDFKICCNRPYKYPDFRPAFGEIFRDYIKEYDYWAYSEHDMIYGDLRAFFTDELLEKYDRFLGNGHLSVYRNVEKVNSAYKNCPYPSYKTVFTNERNFFFEEYYGTSYYWDRKLHDRFYQNKNILDDISWKHGYFEKLGGGKDSCIKHLLYTFENGKVYRLYNKSGELIKEETLYVHFQKRPLKVSAAVSDKFAIIPNEIVKYSKWTPADVSKLSKGPLIYKQAIKVQKKRLMDKIFRITHPNVIDIMRNRPNY